MSMSQVGSGLPRLLAERYELVEQLATGGMTSVWRGHDRVLGRDVVVKVLHPELAADERFKARFHEEAVNAARLTHPNIVALYDTGEQGDVAYIVMELVEGSTLREVLARHGPLAAPQAARLAREVTVALDYAHQAGVVHRNLKPGNVLLADDGTVKVADFSIARAATDDDPTRTGEILGADGYLAPEIVQGQEADGRADVYALGACLYEMLTGRPPGPDPVASFPPRARVAGVPRDLDAVVQRAMAPDPADRFQTARAMGAALARSAAGAEGGAAGGLVARPEPPAGPDTPPAPGFLRNEGRWLGWTLALVALAGILMVVGLALSSDRVGDLFRGGPSKPKQTTGTAAGQTTLRFSAAQAYDPPPGDGNESDGDLDKAIDRDPATAWVTEGYNSAELGGLKPGVGLVLELPAARPAHQLRLTLTQPGAGLAVYAADQVPAALDGWGRPLWQSQAAGQQVTVDLDGASHRYYLVWFTRLPKAGDRYRAGVAEASLRS
jgi:eukaryotic-like serine/threonine-protein kinase